jgi:hypothetical protein
MQFSSADETKRVLNCLKLDEPLCCEENVFLMEKEIRGHRMEFVETSRTGNVNKFRTEKCLRLYRKLPRGKTKKGIYLALRTTSKRTCQNEVV